MRLPRQNKALKYFISTAALIVLFAYSQGAFDASEEPRRILLSEDRIEHILHGDGVRSGGHKYGTGTPCKSEFPKGWSDEKIIDTTKKIAANDNNNWRREDNGYYVTETMEGGVRVRVVLGPQKRRVITSYPTNQPRNPCPANNY